MKLVGNSRAIRSPEFHKKKQKERAFRLSLFVVLFILIVAIPAFAMRHERLLINNVVVEGNGATTSEEIEDIVRERLQGNLLWFIPRANALIAPEGRIEERLLADIPRLSSAEVNLDNLKTLRVVVRERTPFALYCENIEVISHPSKCFFLDQSGNIFSEAPDFSGEVYMIYSASPVLESPLRSQLIEPKEFGNINAFVSELQTLGILAKAVVRRGEEYAAVLSGGAELKWRSGQNLSDLVSDLRAFLRDSKMKAAAFGDLMYIDLRFDNKIYWLPKE